MTDQGADRSEEFKQAVRSFIDVSDRLAAVGKELAAMRKHKAELAEAIVAFMQSRDLEVALMGDVQLIRKTCKRLGPLKKEHIADELTKAVGAGTADRLLTQIYGHRPIIEKDTLSRKRVPASASASASAAAPASAT